MSYIEKKQAVNLRTGMSIQGKWQNNTYKVIRKLGEGAIGSVYLVQSKFGLLALKIGDDKFGIISEVNVLKQLAKVQGQSLGPYFIEMDDWDTHGFTYPFYVMEYLKGDPLLAFVKKRGTEWSGILMIQLLVDLEKLHKEGWVFGDLKPDNLLVAGSPPHIRWLDVGGMTRNGRSIKEYTEFFDRGYWGLGSRKAEPSYDLFSLAMIFLNIGYPNRFQKTTEGFKQLERYVLKSPVLKHYETIITKALRGSFSNATMMRTMIVRQLSDHEPLPSRRHLKTVQKTKRKKRKSKWFLFVILVTFFLVFYLLYLN